MKKFLVFGLLVLAACHAPVTSTPPTAPPVVPPVAPAPPVVPPPPPVSPPVAPAPPVVPPVVAGPTIPSTAKVESNLHLSTKWEFNHDPGTPGTATGTTALVTSPSLSGKSRQFKSTYTDEGGEIFHLSFANDLTAHNFVYDAEVYIASGSKLTNLEMDMNQVIANGNTTIFGFQCDGYSRVWDYGDPWLHSKASCNVNTWTTNVWHHVQIAYYRDDSGNLYFTSVWLDGNEQAIGGKQAQSKPLKWTKGDLLTNFQIDGTGASGSSTLYVDKLSVSRW